MEQTLSETVPRVRDTMIHAAKELPASPGAPGPRLAVEYILPLKWSHGAQDGQMTAYLRDLSGWVDVTVIDGSPPAVFAAHRRKWAAMVRHVPPAGPVLPNGKVHGVLTGLALSRHERIVIADDDVRHTRESLRRMHDLLEHAEVVRPQNHFTHLPWHARWDTARSLVNRAWGSDYPGTLGVRAGALAHGYRGDVLFENLELIRTVKANGGREIRADDFFIERLPPTARHFWRQRVRQAYDSQAQPLRLAAELALLPALALQARRPLGYALWIAGAIGTAAVGRCRNQGSLGFGATAPLWAPLWVAERAVAAWIALGHRADGGMPYAGARLKDAASSPADLTAYGPPEGGVLADRAAPTARRSPAPPGETRAPGRQRFRAVPEAKSPRPRDPGSGAPRGTGTDSPGEPRFRAAGRDGGRLHVYSSGSGPDTYVLIHGIGASSRYFRPLATELARTATVHSLELPGHGSTPKPRRPLSVPDYARAVWEALDELGVSQPVLVGHSMGSQVAVEMANMRPSAPEALVLLGPTNYPPERGFWRQCLRLGQDTLGEPWRINAIVFSDYGLRCGMSWYLKTVPAMLSNRIEDGIDKVQVPVLVVRGSGDPIVPAAWTAALARLAPQGTMAQVEGENHVAMYRSAATVAALCRSVVART